MDNQVLIDGVFIPAINFSMQQNAVPTIRQLSIENQSETAIENIEVSIQTSPEFSAAWSMHIDALPAGESYCLGAVNLAISPDYLFSLTEKISGTVELVVRSADEILGQTTRPIDLLSYDQWAGLSIMPEMLAAFVTPNHPEIPRVLAAAGALLEKWDGDPSFTAYQSQDPNRVRKQIAAIYGAIQQENIMYIQAPPSFEVSGQRIRLCDAIFNDKMANCLDLTLLFAACLEAVGLNALLVCMEGHAFAACWLEDECFPECVQDDYSLLSKRIAEGIHEICLIECTAMTAGGNTDFSSAERAATKQLETTRFDLAIDVKRSRGSGIRPIPLRVTGADGKTTYEQKPLRENQTDNITSAPGNVEIFDKFAHVDTIQTTKQQLWERKLLDLSLRNTLLNFRVTKKSIQLLTNDLSRLEDAISDGEEFQIMHLPQDLATNMRDSKIFEVETGKDILEVMIDTEFSNRRLRTFLTEGEIAQSVTHLYRQAKTGREENGANTLFLALGFLRWYESDVSQKARYAPLVLLPIDIVRKSAFKGYVVRIRDEEPQMNITLLEMLKQSFGLSLSGLDPLPTDEKGVDLKLIFNTIRQAVMDRARWDVEPLAFLGIFSFGQFIMWNDIRNRSEELHQNKVVASLMAGNMTWQQETDFPKPEELDTLFSPADLAIPTSTDSSQLTAICAASKGESFVLHGPPGTGKSQTITNIIANMLFQGKTVLFIAEKMAALSVVQKRLSDVGLGPFSLELHSNKARKKDVLSQLEETLSIGQIKPPENYHAEAERLHSLRQNLNDVMKATHKKRSYGVSLYEAITIYEQYKDASGDVEISSALLESLTGETHTQWVDALDKVAITAQACGGAHNNPLAALRCTNYSGELASSLKSLADSYKQTLLELADSTPKVTALFATAAPDMRAQYFELADLGRLLFEGEYIPQKLYRTPELFQLENTVATVCQCGKQRNALASQLLNDFSESILTFDEESSHIAWNAAAEKWFLPKALGQNKVVKSLRLLCKNPAILEKQNIPAILDAIRDYKQNAKVVDENAGTFNTLFGLVWNNGNPDFDTVSSIYMQAAQLRRKLLGFCDDVSHKLETDAVLANSYFSDPTAFRQINMPVYKRFQGLLAQAASLEQRLMDEIQCDFRAINEQKDWIAQSLAQTEMWLDNIRDLRDWCVFLSTKQQADDLGLLAATSALEQGVVTEQTLRSAFDKALYLSVADAIVQNEPVLANFSGAVMKSNISHYRDACDSFEKLTRNELVARLSAKVPNAGSNVADSSEIGILKRAIRSGGRGLSIRKLFDMIPHLLPRLCPCLLMSPISVAQYIDPSYPQFDLVIFDEASQLPTSEAVGAIARGKNLIVVGDPKQLPPTSFFESNHVDEDNIEQEDLESILDDCLALSIPETYLLWHYRSKHESLIAFSNREFYDNGLFTFPSPNDLKSEVEFIPVKGFYDRSKTRQNNAEATAVVEEIRRRLADEKLRSQSIGVVTFSSVQQNLIEDKLQEVFAKHPELDEWNSNAAEPVFVKNLENVQGDERDVILFSVGYGPDAQGKVTLNFGPLNRAGGWRRLNVAVSRARRKMIVYSTLMPEQIDLAKTRADGVAGLRAFLEFAKNGKQALRTHTLEGISEPNALTNSIAQALEQTGCTVSTNIGYSRYRIDLGIVHPERPKEFVLGILIDGEQYRNAATARDRNVLQDGMLQTLGWNIHRVYSIDWLQNPDKEVEKIQSALEDALQHPANTEAPSASVSDSVALESYERLEDADTSVKAAEHYSVCSLAPVSRPAEEFYLPQNASIVMAQILEVINTEAPISSSLLTKRVIALWGMTRAGNRIVSYMKDLCSRMRLHTTKTLNGTFYWKADQQPEQYDEFRAPRNDLERRNMDLICREEIASAVKNVLETQVSLPREDLKREVYKLFGFSRIGQSMDAYINEGINYAVKHEMVLEDGEQIVLN